MSNGVGAAVASAVSAVIGTSLIQHWARPPNWLYQSFTRHRGRAHAPLTDTASNLATEKGDSDVPKRMDDDDRGRGDGDEVRRLGGGLHAHGVVGRHGPSHGAERQPSR